MNNIRNFSIIAHIDHGKSTLSDRILEITHTVESRHMKEQLLDSMDLERERGITIKMQPVRIDYQLSDDLKQQLGFESCILNLIDTPGHVDFNYEVSRSLAAVEGAVLLVDATKGIQAQTIANLYLALDQDLEIIPVVNKIDLPNARVDEVKTEIAKLLGINEVDILEISGKTGKGVPALLEKIVTVIPAPKISLTDSSDSNFRALIFDSLFDPYKGVIANVRVVEGSLKQYDKIEMFSKEQAAEALEIGVFKPKMSKVDKLSAGEIGYIATGLKEVGKVRVGDTIISWPKQSNTQPLAEYKEPVPVVFAGIYPKSGEDYPILKDALSKLKLTDSSLTYEDEAKEILGKGFRCGFLGMLHIEIITERLRREFNLDLVISSPSVSYTIHKTDGEVLHIYTPAALPEPNFITQILEPWVKMEVITPKEYIGGVMKLLDESYGALFNTEYLSEERVVLTYEVPLAKIIVDFYDGLKSVSSGFASINYELIGERQADLVKVDILVAGDPVEALTQIVRRDEAAEVGKRIVHKLKNTLSRAMFAIPIQAAVGGKIVARETISPFRKDVTAKLYGGDVTRKNKLLNKQKEGKKRMKQTGKIDIPKEVYLSVLKK